MDWEIYEQHRASLIFMGVACLSFLLLAFQQSSPVQHVKTLFVSCTFPTQRYLSQLTTVPAPEKVPMAPPPSNDLEEKLPPGAMDVHAEYSRELKILIDENRRLTQLVELKRQRWPQMVVAHVVNRDPQRWFQEALLDKGLKDGIQVDDPVIMLAGNREALVGRIVEVGLHSSKVMLIQDSLSAVAATVSGASREEGVVEGSNSHDLYLKYLSRDSQMKIGDLVVTSGLGETFPEGIPIGWVEDMGLDPRQLFLQARLRPSIIAHPLRLVGILTKNP